MLLPRTIWINWKKQLTKIGFNTIKNLLKIQVQPEERDIRVSITDPDSGYMGQDGKPEEFF
jgi:hypothetical protein